MGTAQRFIRVDKVIRELCTHVVECHTLLGRWTFQKRYDAEDYEEMLHQVDVVKNTKSLVGVLLLSSPTHCENLMILSRCWNLQRQRVCYCCRETWFGECPKDGGIINIVSLLDKLLFIPKYRNRLRRIAVDRSGSVCWDKTHLSFSNRACRFKPNMIQYGYGVIILIRLIRSCYLWEHPMYRHIIRVHRIKIL